MLLVGAPIAPHDLRVVPRALTPDAHTELDRVAAIDRRVTELLPHLRERRALLEIAGLGWRRADLVAALEALVTDPTMPAGGALELVRSEAATRELALHVRAQLGVGPTQAPRVHALASEVRDPILRDLVLAHVPIDPDATTLRLVAHWHALPDDPVWLGVDYLLRASATASALHARTRRARWAPDNTFTVAPSRRSAGSARAAAMSTAHALLPGFAFWPHTTAAPVALANTAPRVSWSPLVLRRDAGSDARTDPTYRAFVAGAATVDASLLVDLLGWPLSTRLAALDGLGDAPSLSDAGVHFLDELVRTGAQLDTRRVDPGDQATLDAATAALCAHAPSLWAAFLDELATSVSPSIRMAAAGCAGEGPFAGPALEALLGRLELDPAFEVRVAAREAWRRRDQRHTTRLWARRVVWSVLRRDEAAELVHGSLTSTAPSEPSASELRRLRRVLDRLELDRDAREKVALAFGAPRTPLGPSVRAFLTATDGQSIDVAIALADTAEPTDVLATVVQVGDLHCALLQEIVRFVHQSPSSYMRLTEASGRETAVRARVTAGAVVLISTDPRILEQLPPRRIG